MKQPVQRLLIVASTGNNGIWADGSGKSVSEEKITGAVDTDFDFDRTDDAIDIASDSAYSLTSFLGLI